MSPDLIKALLTDIISGLNIEELRNVIMKTAEQHLDDVGRAALEEKEKRNIDPTRATPVVANENVVVTGEDRGGSTSQEGGASRTQGGTIRVTKKRKCNWDIIEISDDESDLSEDDTVDPPPTPNSTTSIPVIIHGPVTKKLHDLLEGGQDRLKGRLTRMATIMNTTDWTGFSNKVDTFRYLVGREQEVCEQARVDTTASLPSEGAMNAFIYRHHTKLEQCSPAFAAYWASDGQPQASLERVETDPHTLEAPTTVSTRPTQISEPPSHPTRTERVSLPTPRPIPPFDWGSITAEFALVDVLKVDDYMRAIVKDFRIAFKSIEYEIKPRTTSIHIARTTIAIDISRIVQLADRMSMLAINMSEARPRKLYNRLMDDRSFQKLRACMFAICQAVSKHDPAVFRSNVHHAENRSVLMGNVQQVWNILKLKDDSQELRDQYSGFLACLKGTDGGGGSV